MPFMKHCCLEKKENHCLTGNGFCNLHYYARIGTVSKLPSFLSTKKTSES